MVISVAGTIVDPRFRNPLLLEHGFFFTRFGAKNETERRIDKAYAEQASSRSNRSKK